MSLNVAKCNFSNFKLQTNVVYILPLKYMRSMGWPQGPLLALWLAMHSMLAFWADLCGSGVKENLCRFWLQALPSLFGVVRWVNMGSGEFLQCDNASWWLHARVVPARRVAMDTSLLCLRCSGSCPTLKAPVPKLIYWRWVQCLLITMGPPLYLVIRATWRSSRLQGKGSTSSSQLS